MILCTHGSLLQASYEGNKKLFFANTSHPLFNDINNILKKMVGIDQIIEKVIRQIGDLHSAYLTGDLAMGKDYQIINLTLVDHNLDRQIINSLAINAERFISRKIHYIIIS